MKTFSSVALCVLLAAVAVSAQTSLRDLAELTEDYRVRFDALHEDKDSFIRISRNFIRAEIHGLNTATLENLGNARNTIDDILTEVREDIAEAILEPNAPETCLLNLVNTVIAEGRVAGNGMSSCAADKIAIKESLGDEFRALTNTLQRIAQAASEYTLYTFAIHNSVTEPEEHAEWLENNYATQQVFWNEVARPEAQEDLDNLEINRPQLIADNQACLNAVIASLNTAMENVRVQIGFC